MMKVKTEISMTTKKKSKVGASNVPTSSTSMVNNLKKKSNKRSEEVDIKKKKKTRVRDGVSKLDRAKERALEEEKSALDIINKIKRKSESQQTNEDDYKLVYEDMYRQLRRIIKKVEKGCIKAGDGRGTYQLATLYTQLRETVSDLRSLADYSDQAEQLIEQVLKPLFTQLVQNTTNGFYAVKLKIKDKVKETKIRRSFDDIDTITVEQGKLLSDLYLKTCTDIKNILLGEPK